MNAKFLGQVSPLRNCETLKMAPWTVETAIKESSAAYTRNFDLAMLIQKVFAAVLLVFRE